MTYTRPLELHVADLPAQIPRDLQLAHTSLKRSNIRVRIEHHLIVRRPPQVVLENSGQVRVTGGPRCLVTHPSAAPRLARLRRPDRRATTWVIQRIEDGTAAIRCCMRAWQDSFIQTRLQLYGSTAVKHSTARSIDQLALHAMGARRWLRAARYAGAGASIARELESTCSRVGRDIDYQWIYQQRSAEIDQR